MKVQAVKEYEYAMPHFTKPDDLLNVEPITDVTGVVSLGKRAINYNFDWSVEESLKSYVDGLMEDEDVEEEHREEITKTIREHAQKQKATNEADKKKRQAEYDAIPEQERNALNSVVKLKFYPQNKKPNLEELGLKSRYINRYYKNADKVL